MRWRSHKPCIAIFVHSTLQRYKSELNYCSASENVCVCVLSFLWEWQERCCGTAIRPRTPPAKRFCIYNSLQDTFIAFRWQLCYRKICETIHYLEYITRLSPTWSDCTCSCTVSNESLTVITVLISCYVTVVYRIRFLYIRLSYQWILLTASL